MNKLKDFNEVMEEMDKIEESNVSDSLLEDLYEIYKDEINEEEALEKFKNFYGNGSFKNSNEAVVEYNKILLDIFIKRFREK